MRRSNPNVIGVPGGHRFSMLSVLFDQDMYQGEFFYGAPVLNDAHPQQSCVVMLEGALYGVKGCRDICLINEWRMDGLYEIFGPDEVRFRHPLYDFRHEDDQGYVSFDIPVEKLHRFNVLPNA